MQDQRTQNPICPVCKTIRLTDEEVTQGKSCWYCIVDTFCKMNLESAIPEPAAYGRPSETKETGILKSKSSFPRAHVPDPGAVVDSPIDAAKAQIANQMAPGAGRPAIVFSEAERKKFTQDFGVDPVPKSRVTEIVVHSGKSDDTYLKFSIPIPVDVAEEKEIKRIMSSVLDIFGKLLKYGPQFAATLIELQNMSGDMFIGGRR